MKVNYKANGVEFEIRGETMFVHIDQMFYDLAITKARIDEFCGDKRCDAYGVIASYTASIYGVVRKLSTAQQS